MGNHKRIYGIGIFVTKLNAKVLALARLNATPELMSMPLTMISLGMDIYSVVNVCVNLLDEVANRLRQNRFVDEQTKDVRKVILDLGKEGVYDSVTTQSLLKVYDLAQELRAITSFYKVNQGVDAKYEKLLAWVDGLSKIKLERDKILDSADLSKGEVSKLNQLKQNSLYKDIVGQKIDFNRLFTDSDYQSKLIAYMEETKVGINYIDIILNSPNFKALLEGVNFDLNIVSDISFLAALSQKLVQGLDEELNSDDYIELTVTSVQELPTSNKKNDYNLNKKVQEVAHHIVIADALSNLNYAFKRADIESEFGETSLPLGNNVVFDLHSNHGINTFVNVLHEIVIPKLMKKYSDNFFILSLLKKQDYITGKTLWALKYNSYNVEDKSESANINQAKLEFENIMKYNSGLKTVTGENLTIGEVFFLYDLITHKNRVSSLNTAVKSGVLQYSPIAQLIEDSYRKYDHITQQGNIDSIIDSIGAEKLNAIVDALRSDSRSTTWNGKQLNLKDGWFYHQIPLTKASTLYLFDAEIKNIFKESNKGAISLNYSLRNGDLIIRAQILQGNYNLNYTGSILGVSGNIQDMRSILLTDEQIKILRNEILMNTRSVLDVIASLPVSTDNTIVKIGDLKEQFGQDSAFKRLLSSIKTDTDLVVIENSDSKARRVNKSFLVLYANQNIAILRKSALATNYDEVIDLLIELQAAESNIIPDLNNKVNLYIHALKPNIETTGDYLQDMNLLSKKQQQLVEKYIDYLLELELDDHFKSMCLSELDLYSKRLARNPEFYYYKTYKDSTLNIGDRYSKDGISYLYLGKKKGNQHTLVSIDKEQPKVLSLTDKLLETFTKVGQIKRSPFYILTEINSDKYQYKDFIKTDIENINITDKVKINDEEWVVSDIVYDQDKSGFKKLLIIYKDGEFKLIDNKNYISAKSNYYHSTNTRIQSTIDIVPQLLNYYNFFNDLTVGDIVEMLDGTIYTYYKQQNESYIICKDINNNLINVSINDIAKLKLNVSINPDKAFKLDVRELEVIDSNSESKTTKSINPELFGYTELIEDVKLKSNKSIITYTYRDYAGWTIRNLNDYQELADTSSIKANNVVIVKTDILEDCYKILEVLDDGYLVYHIDSFNNFNVKILKRSDLENSNIRVYSKDLSLIRHNSNFAELQDNFVDSMTQKGLLILDLLEEKFGIKFTIVEDPNMGFAEVKQNQITINTYNTNGLSKGEFIAKLALHEFTHIALANMQAQSPESYFALIKYVENLTLHLDKLNNPTLNAIWEKIQYNTNYKSDTEKYEEFIVRYIENLSHFTNQTDVDLFIQRSMTTGFNKLFNNLIKVDNLFEHQQQNVGIAQLLSKYAQNFFKETTEDFNINFIMNESILLNMYDNIKQIC